jgi:hypothetical protein
MPPAPSPDLLSAELAYAPSPLLARFVLALVSKRKSGTSLADSRNGTKGAVSGSVAPCLFEFRVVLVSGSDRCPHWGGCLDGEIFPVSSDGR